MFIHRGAKILIHFYTNYQQLPQSKMEVLISVATSSLTAQMGSRCLHQSVSCMSHKVKDLLGNITYKVNTKTQICLCFRLGE